MYIFLFFFSSFFSFAVLTLNINMPLLVGGVRVTVRSDVKKKKHWQLCRVDHIGVIRGDFPIVSDACVRSFSQLEEPQMRFFSYALIWIWALLLVVKRLIWPSNLSHISSSFRGFSLAIIWGILCCVLRIFSDVLIEFFF